MPDHSPNEPSRSAPPAAQITGDMASVKGGVLGEASGRLAGAVFMRTASGTTYLREHVIPRDPKTPKQLAWRELRSRAMRAYGTLDPLQVQKWERFCSMRRASGGGACRPVNVFVSLATKFLQVEDGRPIPLDPPDALFVGDAVAVAASAAPGGVLFTSANANHAGITTELLLAPMRTAGANPRDRDYRHQRFVAFSGPVSEFVASPTGWWAAAVRFVQVGTGQMSGLVRLGFVRVA